MIWNILVQLSLRFPKAFAVFNAERRPLKIGITEDLIAAAPDIDQALLRAAVRHYCRWPDYLSASVAGAVRVDLNGEPAGVLNAGEAAFARKKLTERKLAKPRPPKPCSATRGGERRLPNASALRNYAPPPRHAASRHHRQLKEKGGAVQMDDVLNLNFRIKVEPPDPFVEALAIMQLGRPLPPRLFSHDDLH